MSAPRSPVADADLRNYALLVWGLMLASAFSFFLTAVAGLVLAYVKRPDAAGTVWETHFTSAIRTFWISVIVGVLGAVLTLVLVGIAVLGLLTIWQIFRVIRGLIYAIERRPIERPTGWL